MGRDSRRLRHSLAEVWASGDGTRVPLNNRNLQ